MGHQEATLSQAYADQQKPDDVQTLPSASGERIVNYVSNSSTKQSPTDVKTLLEVYGSLDSEDSVANKNQCTALAADRNDSAHLRDSDNGASTPKNNWWRTVAPIHRILSSILDEPVSPYRSTPRPWRTTLIRFGPLSGIFCMLLAIASMTASLGILAGSRGVPVAHWAATPSTYLAVCTAVANLAMRYACIQGVIIAWWTMALRGSGLAKLHYAWRSGTTLRGALTSGRHMGLLGLACIVSTIVVVDGPVSLFEELKMFAPPALSTLL